jgi:cell division protein FtsL
MKVMYCEKCGAPLSPEDVYCPECGAKVEDDATVRMGYNSGQSHREYVQEKQDRRQSDNVSWQNQQRSRQQGNRYRPDEQFYQSNHGNQHHGSGNDGKDKILYIFLGVITAVLVVGIIWGVMTLINLNNEEDVTVEAKEATAEEINPDLESETEEEVTVTPSEAPTAEPTSTPIPTPAVTAVPTVTPVPTQAPTAAPASSDYVIPDSSTRELTNADLAGLSEWELRVARNEIYARHGRMFEDEALDSYFRGKSWYVPSIPAASFDDNQLLTKTELRNAKLISDYEAAHGYN